MIKVISIKMELNPKFEDQIDMFVDEMIDLYNSFCDFLKDLEQEETESYSCHDEDDLDSLPIAKKV